MAGHWQIGHRPSAILCLGPTRCTLSSIGWALLILLGLALSIGLFPSGPAAAANSHIDVLRVRGIIDPAMAGYIERGISQAEADGAAAVVIELDTPGGLMDSMREITQRIISSQVPVVMYVAPPGARAASAGVFITYAAHIAAMAPNTNIGAAHPVDLGGQQQDQTMVDKATNDAVAAIRSLAERRGRNADWAERAVRESISATEQDALRQNVVNLIADNRDALLQRLDGREVELATGRVTIHTAGAAVRVLDMNLIESFLHTISNPNIAYILLMVGVYGLIYELASPGAIFPGVVGVISLLLAFYSLGTLPVNYVGLGLIFFAVAMFIGEAFITSHGLLTIGGVVALALGSVMLINVPSPYGTVAWPVIAGVVLATAGFFFFVVVAILRVRLRPVTTGQEAIAHAHAVARTDLAPEGYVFLEGELWRARAENGSIPKGSIVRVVRQEGLTLFVERQPDS